MTNKSIAVCVFAAMLAGCSSANVTKNPGPDDNGIRYYRPKPYLLVTPADATGRMVKLEVLQLQDYSEEYSIHPKGRKPPAVALKDGWNLVAVGGPAPPSDKPEPAAAPPADPTKLPEYVMASSNIPIGVYESVFDSNGRGGKYLKGWRYIGTSIYGGGDPNGIDPAVLAAQAAQKPSCRPGRPNGGPPPGPTGSAIQGPLYGIVFFNGAMTFRQIDEIGGNMTCPQYAKTIPEPAPASVPAPAPPEPVKPGATLDEPKSVKPGAIAPKTESPPTPSPNPGPQSLKTPKPDMGVIQTAGKPEGRMAKSTSRVSARQATPKGPDATALTDLEAEVFKRLNLSVPVETDGTTSAKSSNPLEAASAIVPELSPAAPK
jgi:hypothetical protein